MTPYLNKLFGEYDELLSGLPYIQSVLVPHHFAVLDIFAFLPELDIYVDCWSSITSRIANRVFVEGSSPSFAPLRTQGFPTILTHANYNAVVGGNDLSLIILNPKMDAIALLPIHNAVNQHIGVVRIVGEKTQLAANPFLKARAPLCLPRTTPRTAVEPDLYPHVLGRWAGTVYESSATMRERAVQVLLRAFSSFISKACSTYWKKEVESARVSFGLAGEPETEAILSGLSDGLEQPQHMFSIVARYGNAEILTNFPEDLDTTQTPNLRQWEADVYFQRLKARLDNADLCYYCIPLKVDDCVIGVFSLLTPREKIAFKDAARFARSCLSEMGRTIDKESLSRAATSIRRSAFVESHPATHQNPSEVGRQLIQEIAQLIVPTSTLKVGILTYDIKGRESFIPEGLPPEALPFLKTHMWDILKTREIRLVPSSLDPATIGSNAFLSVPITAGKPYLLYLFGPIEAMSGRSLRAALEELQAVLYLSFITASQYLASDDIIEEVRSSLNLWAHVHDLKNDVARFGSRMADLSQLARGGKNADLQTKVLDTTDSFENLVEEWKEECDRLLDKSFTRHREEISVLEWVSTAFQRVADRYPEVMSSAQLEVHHASDVRIVSYGKELQVILQECFVNVAKHFQRTHAGAVDVTISRENLGLPVAILIGDTVYEEHAFEDVRQSLDSGSKSTLGRIKKTVERLLEGAVWAQRGPKGENVRLGIRLPLEVKPH